MNQKNGKGAFNMLKASAEMSKINPVPSYRAYGVTKRENIFTYINEVLAILLGWFIYIPYFFVILIGTVFMVKVMGKTGIVFVFLLGFLVAERAKNITISEFTAVVSRLPQMRLQA